MTKVSQKEDSKQKKLFELFTEIVGWLQIIASPLLLSAIIGFVIYISSPNTLRLIIAIGITLIGLIIGIIWATYIWKKRGTITFVSRIDASPELDNLEKNE